MIHEREHLKQLINNLLDTNYSGKIEINVKDGKDISVALHPKSFKIKDIVNKPGIDFYVKLC